MKESSDVANRLRAANPIGTDSFDPARVNPMVDRLIEVGPTRHATTLHSWRLKVTLAIAAALLVAVAFLTTITSAPPRSGPDTTHRLALRGTRLLYSVGPGFDTGADGRKVLGDQTRIDYRFSISPTLPSVPATGEVYALQSSGSVQGAATGLARDLGVTNAATSSYIYTATTSLPVWNQFVYQIGTDAGPHVMTFIQSGVIGWAYVNPASSNGQALPSNASAVSAAKLYLERAGVRSQLVYPEVNEIGTSLVSVSLSLSVDGIVPLVGGETNFPILCNVTFGPGGVVLSAYGVLATTSAVGSYPTMTATEAVSVLQHTNFYLPFAGDAGVSEPNPPTTSPPLNVVITSATSGLATVISSHGQELLVPMLSLSNASSFDASVVTVHGSEVGFTS
jgi:hypothetical protein